MKTTEMEIFEYRPNVKIMSGADVGTIVELDLYDQQVIFVHSDMTAEWYACILRTSNPLEMTEADSYLALNVSMKAFVDGLMSDSTIPVKKRVVTVLQVLIHAGSVHALLHHLNKKAAFPNKESVTKAVDLFLALDLPDIMDKTFPIMGIEVSAMMDQFTTMH